MSSIRPVAYVVLPVPCRRCLPIEKEDGSVPGDVLESGGRRMRASGSVHAYSVPDLAARKLAPAEYTATLPSAGALARLG
jgi:hypothetical protein